MSVLPWSRPAEKALYTLAGRFYGAPPRKEFSRMDPFKTRVTPAEGKLAVLLPGMCAVATTFIAGVGSVKANLAPPIGTLTQMAHLRLGTRSEKRWAATEDLD